MPASAAARREARLEAEAGRHRRGRLRIAEGLGRQRQALGGECPIDAGGALGGSDWVCFAETKPSVDESLCAASGLPRCPYGQHQGG
jgi:hypothetical protein